MFTDVNRMDRLTFEQTSFGRHGGWKWASMKTFLLVVKWYIQNVSQAVVFLLKPEFHLLVLMRAVLRKGLPCYKSPHNSLPSVALWDRKEVNPGVGHV